MPLLSRQLSGEIGYQHDLIGDEKTSTSPGASGRYTGQEANIFYARILFAFGT